MSVADRARRHNHRRGGAPTAGDGDVRPQPPVPDDTPVPVAAANGGATTKPPPPPIERDATFEVSFELGEAELWSVARALTRRRPGRTVQAAVVIAVIAVGMVIASTVNGARSLWIVIGGVLAAALPWVLSAAAAHARRRHLRAGMSEMGPRHVVATPVALSVSCPSGTRVVPWPEMTDVSAVGKWVVLEESGDVVHAVPEDVVDDVERFRAAVNSWRVSAGGTPLPPTTKFAAPWLDVPWSARRAVLATVIVLLIDMVISVAVVGISETAGPGHAAFGSLAVVAGGVWLALRRRPGALRSLLGPRPRALDIGAGLAVGALILAINASITAAAGGLLPPEVPENPQQWLDDLLLAAPVATGIAVVLTAPITEELLFRGLLFRGLHRRWGAGGAAALSAGMFALVHPVDLSPASMVLVVSTFVTGVVLAVATLRRGTLATPIVAHMLLNAVAIVPVFLGGAAPAPGQAAARPDLGVSELALGTCANEVPAGDTASADPVTWTTVACDEPHHVEVFGAWTAGGPWEPYPGDGALGLEADEGCAAEFEGYVGLEEVDSRLTYVVSVPSEASWRDGDRQVICVLIDLEGDDLVGSARGSGW